MQIRRMNGRKAKKEAPTEVGAFDRAEAKSLVMAGAREEDWRPTGRAETEGGGYGFNSIVGSAGPREEDTERRRSDKANIGFDRLVSNA